MTIVFLLEEKSMKVFLDGILRQIIPSNVSFITIPHEGKSDLQKSVATKLKGWNDPDAKFVIVQDQDANDCYKLKEQLVNLCSGSNKDVLIRIACHELEAWYFGDLNAVGMAYGCELEKLGKKKKYRNPDDIIAPKKELQKIIPEHQQISGARKIAQYIDVERNTSVSFRVFVNGVKKLCCG